MFTHRHKSKHPLWHQEADKTTLADMDDGKSAVIRSIPGGRSVTKRLADLGLKEGAEIKVIGRTPFSGPVQVEVCGSRLALGRGLASRIIIEMK